MIKRPFLLAVLGYIIGIIMGLYFKKSIVFLYIIIFATIRIYKKYILKINNNSVKESSKEKINNKIKSKRMNKRKNEKRKGVLLKLVTFKRYKRYIQIIFNQKTILVLMIFSIISNTIVIVKNQKFNLLYNNTADIEGVGILTTELIEKDYFKVAELKIKEVKSENKNENNNEEKNYNRDKRNTKVYIKIDNKKINNDIKKELGYGDIIHFKGKYIKPEKRRNYKGFDYKEYLKTKNIYGTIKIEKIEILNKDKGNLIQKLANKFKKKVEEVIKNNLDKVESEILIGLLLGDSSQINEETKEKFRICNISHILAVSGMHVTLILMGITKIFGKILGKRGTYIVCIVVLIFYMFVTEFTPSIVRAAFMTGLLIISKLTYNRNDRWNTLSICLFITLLSNPFLILNSGLQFSYLCVIGILLIYKEINKYINNLKSRKIKYLYYLIKKYRVDKIIDNFLVTISVQIMIIPIELYYSNLINPYFLLTNLLVSIIMEPIIFISIVSIFTSFIFIRIGKYIFIIDKFFIDILLLISNMSYLPIAKIYIPTPKLIYVFMYYFIISFVFILYKIYNSQEHLTSVRRIKNLIALFKYRINSKYKFNKELKEKIKNITIVIIIISILVISVDNNIEKDLSIYFVDIGQGDCSFIVTPNNKTILIDGGGNREFDVGKKVLLPYIFDRGYNKIDYIFVSHFDTDHIGGLLTIMEELKVDRVFIQRQPENSKNYEKFLSIVRKKYIPVTLLTQGQKIKVEKDLNFTVLWPTKENIIEDKSLNNNSLVLNLEYKEFSMLFTGDIEKETEEKIVEKYKNEKKKLKANILKVAHHGSKSSSTDIILNEINPDIAVIGVGEDNIFGHPSNTTLENLNERNIKYYRTDLNGEISIKINNKGKIKIKSIY